MTFKVGDKVKFVGKEAVYPDLSQVTAGVVFHVYPHFLEELERAAPYDVDFGKKVLYPCYTEELELVNDD